MEEDKTQLSIDEGQPSLPDTGIQEQVKLGVAGPETLDSPVPERTTGNVIDISGDLIDKIMAEQSVSQETSATKDPPEGGQEWEKPQEEPEPPRRGRRPKNKEAPAQSERPKRKGRPPKAEKQPPGGGGAGKTAKTATRGKTAGKSAPAKEAAPAPPAPAPEEPPQPKDASCGEKEEIVYLDLSQLHPFQDHPFGVRDDNEMKGLVSSVRAGGVHQPALVRPREGGGYEIIAGHRRQRASELAGYKNMPCIVRNMTDDEAVLAMTDDNLRHRETILPSEKAAALKQQYEAIKHQGTRGDGADLGKLSLDKVGERNGMSGKTVQRYIYLNDLVPELKQFMDGGKLSFTPAVEISRIRPDHQKYIAVSIEGQQSSPSKAQAKKLREMDEKNQLNPDVIDAVLSQEKKKEDFDVIISSAELAQYFGKDKTPREMKDQIMALLGEWKEKQPPELGKGEKKTDREK
nr:ParB/RepB/Spo0J family partition protein [uncultured Oscillibacter sp.]